MKHLILVIALCGTVTGAVQAQDCFGDQFPNGKCASLSQTKHSPVVMLIWVDDKPNEGPIVLRAPWDKSSCDQTAIDLYKIALVKARYKCVEAP